MKESLSHDARHLRFLVHAGEILGMSLDYRQTLRNVCDAAVQTVADICLLDIGPSLYEIDLVAAAHRDSSLNAKLRAAGSHLRACEGFPRHTVCDVIETGKPVLVRNIDDRYIRERATSDEHAAFMTEMQYRSLMIVPVVSHVQGLLGALTLVRTAASDERYDENSLLFAQDLGRRCGSAISKAMLFSQTAEVSVRMQHAALPHKMPLCDNLTFDAYYEPAQAELMIGGDWYDAFELPGECYGVSIGDISGHGVDAAALMGGLRDSLRALLYAGIEIGKALEIADRLIVNEFPEGKYATALIAVYDKKNGSLRCAAAGHPGPLVWHSHKQEVIDPFIDRGLPLGVRALSDGSGNSSKDISFPPGSFAVFFTDGLTEWNRNYLAGEEALRKALSDPNIRSAKKPARAIRDAVVKGQHPDDIAILTLCL